MDCSCCFIITPYFPSCLRLFIFSPIVSCNNYHRTKQVILSESEFCEVHDTRTSRHDENETRRCILNRRMSFRNYVAELLTRERKS